MRKLLRLVTLLFAVIVAPNAHADTFTDASGTIIYPDGSVITSYDFFEFNQYEKYSDISFQFDAGTGFVSNETLLAIGQTGTVNFAEPVTDVSIYFQYSYGLHINFFSQDFGELGEFLEPICTTPESLCTAVVSFADPGTFGMLWTTEGINNQTGGIGGVSSMTYTTPEPSAGFLLLTGVVLLGLMMALRLKPQTIYECQIVESK